MEPAYAQAQQLKISRASEIRSVCPYCAVGCSMIAYVTGLGETQSFNTAPHLVHIEGDPDSPINGGSLCPGREHYAAGGELEPRALSQYRPPALTNGKRSPGKRPSPTARLMKDSRDRRFVAKDGKDTVNRNEGFAWTGGATITSEEGYFTTTLFRALGRWE